MRRVAGVAVVLLALTGGSVTGCSSSGSTKTPVTSTAPSTTSGSGASSPLPLTVFAAASLTGAFFSAVPALRRGQPSIAVTYNFAGSNALAAQIEQGGPADVFASADAANMQKLVAKGLVEGPVTFARNRLEIAVAPGNPKHLTGLSDLARSDLSVVLEAPGVPAGDYTRQVLDRLGLHVAPRSLETDVKSALAKVTAGEADATVVYVTDVRAAGPKATGVAVPDADQPVIAYPIAVVKATRHRGAAEAFIAAAVSGEVQRALETAGFLPPG